MNEIMKSWFPGTPIVGPGTQSTALVPIPEQFQLVGLVETAVTVVFVGNVNWISASGTLHGPRFVTVADNPVAVNDVIVMKTSAVGFD